MSYLPEFEPPKAAEAVPSNRDREKAKEGREEFDLAVALIHHLMVTGGLRAGVPVELEGKKFFVCVERLGS